MMLIGEVLITYRLIDSALKRKKCDCFSYSGKGGYRY